MGTLTRAAPAAMARRQRPTEIEAPDTRSSRTFIPRSDPRLLGQKDDGFTEVRADRPRSGRAILRPPFGRLAKLTCCSSGNFDPKCHSQPCFGNDCSNSSRVTYSPRSISVMAARSSFSCVSVSEKLSSAPRVTTATTAPSGRETPSTTIFPLTTVPVATCMVQYYPETSLSSRHATDEGRARLNRSAAADRPPACPPPAYRRTRQARGPCAPALPAPRR